MQDKSESELREIMKTGEEARREIDRRLLIEAEKIAKKIDAHKEPFREDELIFALGAKCECGAPMAYPELVGVQGAWDCADILMLKAIKKDEPGSKTHSGSMPFAFYEVKADPNRGARLHGPNQ